MPQDLFTRIGRFAVEHPRQVIAGWAILLVGLGALGLGLPARLGSGGFDVPGSASLLVQQTISRQFPGQSSDPAVVVLHATDAKGRSALAAAVGGVRDQVSAVPGVAGVRGWGDPGAAGMMSADGRTAYLAVAMNGDQNQQLVVEQAVAAAAPVGAPPGVLITTGGKAALYASVNDISRKDLEKAEVLTFPVTLVVLLLVFGGAIAAGLPVLLAMVSLAVTLGLLYLLTLVTTLSIYVTNTASIIGIAVGIDYALFIVTRYREELAHGLTSRDAVVRSVSTSGRSAAVSGLTVVVALAGMFLVDIQGFRSMAIGSMTVVALAVAASLTLLPAVLGLIGSRIDQFSLRRGRRPRHRASGWHRWALRVMARPVRFLLAALAALLILASPLTGIVLGQPSASTLPVGTGPRVASEQLAAAFGPGIVGPVEILVPTPGGAGAPENIARIGRLDAALQQDSAVMAVSSIGGGAAGLSDIGIDQPGRAADQSRRRRPGQPAVAGRPGPGRAHPLGHPAGERDR